MKLKSLYKVFLCGAFGTVALAQSYAQNSIQPVQQNREQMILTLEDCRAMALDSNKTILGAQLLEQKTEFDRRAMLANFFPKVSAYGFYMYNNNDLDLKFSSQEIPFSGALSFLPPLQLPGFTLPFSLANSFTFGARAVQPVFMGGKIVAGYKMTKIGTQMAAMNKHLNRSEVLVNVDEAYWTYVKTCKLYDAAKSFENTVGEVYKIVEDAVDVGMARENDLLKVRVQLNNARLMVSKANNGKTLSRMNLCHYLGINLLSDIQVDTAHFSIDENLSLDSVSIHNRPDYKLLEMKSKLADENVKVVRADYLPHIGVMASYGYTDALTYKGMKFEKGPSFYTNDRLFQGDGFSFMATLNIPIFDWIQGHNKISSAKREAQISRNEMDMLSEKMELEQTMYRFNAMDARLKVELTQSSLEAADANLRMTRDYYLVGAESLTNLLEAQTQWAKASSEYIEAVGEFKLEYTRYLKAIGLLGN